eukprot:TRINITY_DN22508_c0_g1_i1.p1 TRINITY_DN22508_c0_g1~~TRINITY_DN22508_c0_g1_i1.p1  ORF type:complete len:596 (+),score=101.66 TRINITY_DN22508_c0_g1_i1:65-1789(+)
MRAPNETDLSAIVGLLQSAQKELLECIDARLCKQEAMIQRSLSAQQFATEGFPSPVAPDDLQASPAELNVVPCLPSYDLEDDENDAALRRQSTYEVAQATSRRKIEELKSRGELADDAPGWKRLVLKLVRSNTFEAFFACLIVSNAFLIGFQVEFTAAHLDEPVPPGFNIVQTIYSFFFLVELVLRIAAQGLPFFTDIDNHGTWGWNMLDFFVVVTSLLEVVVSLLSETASPMIPTTGLRILRLLRVTRLIRVIRIVRVVRFIRALRTLVYSIFCTLRALVWSMVLLILIMYAFSILITDSVITEVAQSNASRDSPVMVHFGTMRATMDTLFKSLTGGLNWSQAFDPLVATVGWLYGLVFIFYIAFCYFAVLNVMTGVFCDSAIRSAERDHEMAVQAIYQDKQRYLEAVKNIFDKLDSDKSGSITILEFENHFDNPHIRAMLLALELDATDAWTLFKALDADGDNMLMAEEFLDGCVALRGSAKAVDLASLRKEIKAQNARSEKMLQDILELVHRPVGSLWSRALQGAKDNLEDMKHGVKSSSKSSSSRTVAMAWAEQDSNRLAHKVPGALEEL